MTDKGQHPAEKSRHSASASAADAATGVAVGRQPITSSERYHQIFERNPVGLYRTTLEGKILDCNDACARIFGYGNREALLAQTAAQLYVDLADRARALETLRREHVLRNLEVRFRTKDGQLIWVLENAILLEEEGQQPGVIEGTLLDISDLKRADERLQVEKAHLEQLFEN